MKCSCCGGEIPEGESLCPLCGENMENLKPNKNRKKTILTAAMAAVLCASAVLGWFAMKPTGGAVVKDAVLEPSSMISYSTKKAIHTLLPENNQEVTLFKNVAKDLNSYSVFSSMIQGNSTYIGAQNFVRCGEEILFLQTSFNNYDASTQGLDIDYALCSIKAGEEPVILDHGVQSISCASDKSVYYMKNEKGVPVQYRYSDGEITPVSDLFSADFVMITHCSKDDSVLGLATATITGNSSLSAQNGYIFDGQVRLFSSGESEVYFISPDGAHVYVVDISGENSRSVNVKYLMDKDSAELLTVAENVTECSFYEDSGNMSAIADVTLADDIMNPAGKLVYFNTESKTTQTIAENAVALVESVSKSYSWLNESANELIITEQSGVTAIPAEVQKGSFHFVDQDGTFCAADINGTIFPIFENFYEPESYVYNSDLLFLAEQNDAFYWAKGDQVYKYDVGSLAPIETITLDDDLIFKLESGSEIGYVLCADGSVLEQSGNTLNRKPFGQPSSTIYDSAEDIHVIGLSSNGSSVYFMNSDSVLMEKSLTSDAEPVVLAEAVYDAVVVDNGLYLLKDYSDDGGTLMYKGFSDKKLTALRSNVLALTDTAVQQ